MVRRCYLESPRLKQEHAPFRAVLRVLTIFRATKVLSQTSQTSKRNRDLSPLRAIPRVLIISHATELVSETSDPGRMTSINESSAFHTRHPSCYLRSPTPDESLAPVKQVNSVPTISRVAEVLHGISVVRTTVLTSESSALRDRHLSHC